MADVLAQRAYDITITSYDDSLRKVQSLTQAFQKMDQVKQKLNEQLQKKTETGDTAGIDELKKKLIDLEKQLQNVSKQKDASAKETLLLAKADTEAAKASQLRVKSQIDQEKELDRQIALEQKLKQTLDAQPGSYNAIRNSLNQLRPLLQAGNQGSVINFQGNNLSFDQAIGKFKELSFAEQAFRRQFQQDGTLVGEYSKGIINAFTRLNIGDIIKNDVNKGKAAIQDLETKTNELIVAYRSAQTKGGTDLGNLQAKIHNNVLETEKLRQSVQSTEVQIQGMGGIGNQISSSISKGFKDVTQQARNFAIGFIGITAAFNEFRKLITENVALSDSFADLQIRLKGSKQDVDELVASLKKIPTRTSLESLVDLAAIVSKKGVAKEEIAGVTQALDQLFVVLGKEAGDPHEGTTSIIKLISIFNDDKHVTAERVNEIGASLLKLTTSGVATGRYLIDFAERVGAVRGITGLTLPAIFGMGAALEQLGQRSEVAGTAALQLATKMFSNVPKFAQAAGVSVEEFRKLLKDSPFDALIAVASNLKNSGKDLEEVVTSFGEVGITGGRIKAVLSDIATNGEFVRQKMAAAVVTSQDYSRLTQDAAIKQTNFAATLANVKKQFELIGTDTGFQKVLTAAASAISFLIKLIVSIPFSVIITGLTLLTAAWAYYKGNVISATIAQSANNEATLLGGIRKLAENLGLIKNTAAKAANTLATDANTVAMAAYVAESEAATVATTELNIATKASPLGLILGVIALIVPALAAFGGTTNSTTKALKDQNTELKRFHEIQSDIAKQVANDTAVTVSRVTQLVNILKAENTEQYLKKLAYEELIRISPTFVGTVDDQYNATNRLTSATDQLIKKLREASEARATSSIRDKYVQDQKQKEADAFEAKLKADDEKTTNAAIEAKNKQALASRGVNTNASHLTEQQLNVATSTPLEDTSHNAEKEFDQKQKDAEAASKKVEAFDKFVGADIKSRQVRIDNLTKQLSKFKEGTDDYKKVKVELDRELENLSTVAGITTKTTTTTGSDGGDQSVADLKIKLKGIEDQIAQIDKIKNRTAEQKKQLKDLRTQRAEVIKEIKEEGGSIKDKPTPLSKISNQDKEAFRDIDSNRDEQLSRLKQSLLDRSDFTREEQDIIKIGEDGKVHITKEAIKVRIADEETFLKEQLRIQQEAIDKKLSLLKGGNAEERKEMSTLKLERVTLEQETDKKIYEGRQQALKNQLDNEIKDIQEQNKKIQEDASLSSEDKANFKKQNDLQILNLQIAYQVKVDQLEKALGQQSLKNAKEAADEVRKTKEQLAADDVEILKGQLKDAKDAGDKSVADFKAVIEAQRQAIINSTKAQTTKDAALGTLKQEEDFGVIGRELASAKIQLPIYKKLLDAKVITDTEYSKFIEDLTNKEGQFGAASLANAQKVAENFSNVGDLIKSKLSNIFGFNDGTKKGAAREKLLAETLAETYKFAQTAMQDYFDQEKANIEASKKLAYTRIDLEKQQALATAQSQAERNAIEKKAQAEKDKADKDAFAKNKKIQKEQALINLAIQLSNLAVVATAPGPANFLTIGVAGQIMYAIQAALAIANYALNVGKINSAQYAAGGKVDRVPNGRINVSQNIPTQSNGDDVLATVKRGEVILNEDQQRRIGGPSVFKALGVPGFASGGVVPFGNFNLGDNLLPPINPSSFLGGSEIGELKKIVSGIAARIDQQTDNIASVQQQTNQRIDKIKVQVVAKEVVETHEKIKKAESIGNLG